MTHPARRTFDKIKARAKMDAAKKSYADLGRALGLERQAVGHWFRDRGEPSVQQMKKMAEELGCHWLELVDEEATIVYREVDAARLRMIQALSPKDQAELDAYLSMKAAVGKGAE